MGCGRESGGDRRRMDRLTWSLGTVFFFEYGPYFNIGFL